MRTILSLVIVAIAMPSASLAAGQVRSLPDDGSIVVEGKKEKRICKKFPAPTGSRFGDKRICKSASEWRIEEEAVNRSVNRQDTFQKANIAQDWNDKNQAGMGTPLPR